MSEVFDQSASPKPMPKLEKLANFLPMDAGAPEPLILAAESSLTLLYILNWRVPQLDPQNSNDALQLGRMYFSRVSWHRMGPPNDEAFGSHPLTKHGLQPYEAFEVFSSRMVHTFMVRNRIHPSHQDSFFSKRRHFAISFHDSTFEIIADDYSCENLGNISYSEAIKLEMSRWT